MRARGGVVMRLLRVAGRPVLVRAWSPGRGRFALRAEAVDPDRIEFGKPVRPRSGTRPRAPGRPRREPPRPAGSEPAGRPELERAIERMRFALCLDDDLADFYAAFKQDKLLGPVIRRRPWIRPRRRPWPWEALAWAVTKQLIEAERAAAIQRRIVARWGPHLELPGGILLRDVPEAALLAGRAPAELASMDLAPARALSLVRAAREVAAGRVDLSGSKSGAGVTDGAGSDAARKRLLAIPGIGPWTVQCLGLYGRGDPDALPAGDLAFIKLVGRLSGRGRRATVEEVEEFFAPYAPYRGLAATFALIGWHKAIPVGPPLRRAAAA